MTLAETIPVDMLEDIPFDGTFFEGRLMRMEMVHPPCWVLQPAGSGMRRGTALPQHGPSVRG